MSVMWSGCCKNNVVKDQDFTINIVSVILSNPSYPQGLVKDSTKH